MKSATISQISKALLVTKFSCTNSIVKPKTEQAKAISQNQFCVLLKEYAVLQKSRQRIKNKIK